MSAVLKHIDVRACTMGSREEFRQMVHFVRETRTRIEVSQVVKGIDNLDGIDGLFMDMKNGAHFGKLVIQLEDDDSGGHSQLGGKL